MTQESCYYIFDTSAGWLGIMGSVNGLQRVTLPQRSASEVRKQLGNSTLQADNSPQIFKDLVKRLRAYFDGHQVDFNVKLDLSSATAFQREVWEATRLIPYGETRSYAWVAEQIVKPKALRAVGQALGRNPMPIIVPCHRVLASNGMLGGFGGGLKMKRLLLRLETRSVCK